MICFFICQTQREQVWPWTIYREATRVAFWSFRSPTYFGFRKSRQHSPFCILSMARSTPKGTPLSSPSPTTKLTSLQSNNLPLQVPSRWTVTAKLREHCSPLKRHLEINNHLQKLLFHFSYREHSLPHWDWRNRPLWPLFFEGCLRHWLGFPLWSWAARSVLL